MMNRPRSNSRYQQTFWLESWLKVLWPEWVRVLLIFQCSVACIIQLYIAYMNVTRYDLEFVGALNVLFWLVSAAFVGVAASALITRQSWFAAPLLIGEAMVGLSALYVLWADLSSAYRDWVIIIPAGVMFVVAALVVPPLALRLTHLSRKAWAGGLALISALGLTQFTLQNYVIPNRSQPVIQMTADLKETGRADGVTNVRGVITIKNEGKATAWIPQVFASVQARSRNGDGAVPLDPVQVIGSFNPLTYDGKAFAREASAGIIWLDDLVQADEFLPPNVSLRRAFALDVPNDQVRQLELRVDLTALTNAESGSITTCLDPRAEAGREDFLDQFHQPLYDGISPDHQFSCLEASIERHNFIQAQTDDNPSVMIGYDFSQEQYWAAYKSGDEKFTDATSFDPAEAQRAAERIDESNPSYILSAVDALPLSVDEPKGSDSTTAQAPPASFLSAMDGINIPWDPQTGWEIAQGICVRLEQTNPYDEFSLAENIERLFPSVSDESAHEFVAMVAASVCNL
jgi:hypothetical protein